MKDSFFNINSVAIIWASEKNGKIWNDLLKNLNHFAWDKYWINPNWWNFWDVIFYKNITELPKIVDIAVLAIPAIFIIKSLEEITQLWIKRVIIISAGFKEIWNFSDEEKIKKIAQRNNISILWPNCLWYIDTYKNLNLSFWSKNVKKWNIAMISQSWAMAVAFTDWANMHNLGFSKIISMWNKSDIWENELLLELEKDIETKVIVIYLESIEFGRKFYEISKKITTNKPIILVKAGMSDKWSQAASSHTWALAGSSLILKTAFKQAWIIYTSKLEDLFLWGKNFSMIDDYKNIPDELTIITNAWGPWVMATDHCESLWIKLTQFSADEEKFLMKNMPETASVKNPIDIIWDATSTRYKQILENINSLHKKRAILIMLTPQTVTDTDSIAKIIIDFKNKNPDLYVMTSFMWWSSLKKSEDMFLENWKWNSLLNYNYPQKAILSYSKILKYKKLLNTNYKNLNTEETSENIDLHNLLKEEKNIAKNSTTWKILEEFWIKYLSDIIVKSSKEAENIFDKFWWVKLIAKISSPDIPHKTDVWWIYFNINSKDDSKKAYNTILKNVNKKSPNSIILWVTFTRQLENSWKNKEIFVWLKKDKTFWNILIVWMWWIFINIYEDVSRRLSPICKREIKTMLEQLKWYKILAWYRWAESIDFDKLIDIIFKLQYVFESFPEIKEIDINPIFSNNEESIIVDAKFYL
jgi:acyl-CoA synthetase (NDP forming)